MGDDYDSENTLTKFKKILLQNHWANFNQSWHKASLDEDDQMKGPVLFKGEIIKK